MAAEDRIHGIHGDILMDPAGGSTLVTVASLNSWDLDLSKNRIKVTCFNDVNHVYVDDLPDLKGNYGGYYDAADGLVIFDAIFGTVKVTLELRPDVADIVNVFKGKASIDGKINVSVDGAVTLGGTFTASGPWTRPGSV
jgi:hypothetical protein